MGDVVELAGRAAPLKDDHEFIADLARFAEGLTTEEAIRKKYRLSDDVWTKLGDDDELVRAITDEKTRRIRNGATKRERAQQLVIEAPEILGAIMRNTKNSPRHRIDAAKGLDDISGNAPEAATAQDRFVITINLNGDVEHFDKSISITPNDPNDTTRFDKAATIDAESATAATPAIAATPKRPRGRPRKTKSDDDANLV